MQLKATLNRLPVRALEYHGCNTNMVPKNILGRYAKVLKEQVKEIESITCHLKDDSSELSAKCLAGSEINV